MRRPGEVKRPARIFGYINSRPACSSSLLRARIGRWNEVFAILKPRRKRFEHPQSHFSTWEEVLVAAARVDLTTFVTGRQKTTLGTLVSPAPGQTSDLPLDEPVNSLVICHAVRHPRLGDILIDAGLDRSFSVRPLGSIEGLAASRFVGPFAQGEGEDLASQLSASGIRPGLVLFSHLHPDHTAGLGDLGGTMPGICGRGEAPLRYWPFVFTRHLARITEMRLLDFRSAPEMPILGRCIDIFGDGSVWAVHTPGHTKGHISYLVVSKDGPVLLVGDASHTRIGFEQGIAPGFSTNPARARESLGRLRAFAQAYPDTLLIFGHQL